MLRGMALCASPVGPQHVLGTGGHQRRSESGSDVGLIVLGRVSSRRGTAQRQTNPPYRRLRARDNAGHRLACWGRGGVLCKRKGCGGKRGCELFLVGWSPRRTRNSQRGHAGPEPKRPEDSCSPDGGKRRANPGPVQHALLDASGRRPANDIRHRHGERRCRRAKESEESVAGVWPARLRAATQQHSKCLDRSLRSE